MPPRRDLSDRFARGGADRKKRRLNRPNVPLTPAPATPPGAAVPTGQGALAPADGVTRAPVVAPPRGRATSTFAARRGQAGPALPRAPRGPAIVTDHAAVRHDLQRIGLLAGGIVAIMVVLSFFVH